MVRTSIVSVFFLVLCVEATIAKFRFNSSNEGSKQSIRRLRIGKNYSNYAQIDLLYNHLNRFLLWVGSFLLSSKSKVISFYR